MKKPELLAPAGDFEKLKFAILYGADAVYLSGTSFGLRAKAKNFDNAELATAISYAHSHNVRVYITANIFAHNANITDMQNYFATLAEMGTDAFIISDPGVFQLAKTEAPNTEIHISTQANTTNYASVNFWHNLGASRVILARELSLQEIAETRKKSPETVQLEGFVHGAMCMAYSGRCMLSRYMTNNENNNVRDANLGECTHPCRYGYKLYAEEISRPGKFMPIEEHANGTDIFAAEDLCLVAHIPELLAAGLTSFKIEGRMKTIFYTGLTTKVYRMAIDDFFKDEKIYTENIPKYIQMLQMASHRPFTTGFYFGKPKNEFLDMSYSRSHDFVGIVLDSETAENTENSEPNENGETTKITIEQRNLFELGETLQFIEPTSTTPEVFSIQATTLTDENNANITKANHARQKIILKTATSRKIAPFTLICKPVKPENTENSTAPINPIEQNKNSGVKGTRSLAGCGAAPHGFNVLKLSNDG
ncbi:MAG: U32 family peptidase [Defluviitaleaceae bacterium]|nr:U32 family peptidase [Defluviitaleaceae bacterium]